MTLMIFKQFKWFRNPQLWFAAKINIIQQFLFFDLIDPDPWLLTPFLRYFWSYFSLAPGGIQSGLKK